MLKPAACLSFLLLLASCSKEKKDFELKGTLTNTSGETIYLEKLSQQPVVVDSATIDEKGHFEFGDYRPKIGFYRIKVDQQNFAMLVLDSADKVNVTGNLKDLPNTYKVEGSAETKLFLEFTEMSKQRDVRLDSLNKAVQATMEPYRSDERKLDSISRTFEAPYKGIVKPANDKAAEKIDKNSNRYSCLLAIQSLEPDEYPALYKKLDEGLTKNFPNDQNVKNFHEFVRRSQATTSGQLAPDIVLPDPEGKEIALSSLRGKIVLIDFWASWCGPCRKEMPNVVKAYAKYKSKGFEIFGVSLDQDKDRWKEAIKQDHITWPQVSDLKQWNSSVVTLYSIQGIPYTVLVDREGKILAKDLRGEALEAKLAEVLQ
jgi:peroxiredoxin